jgi:hypothetical protein
MDELALQCCVSWSDVSSTWRKIGSLVEFCQLEYLSLPSAFFLGEDE